MINRRQSPDEGGSPISRSTRILHAVAFGLLLVFVSAAAPAQNEPSASKYPQQITPNTKPSGPALPATIQLANGESIPVSELVPRTEAAKQQIRQMVANIRDAEAKQAEASLDVLSKDVSETAEETKKNIRLARSPLQLTEAKVTWTRNKAELDAIDLDIVRYAAGLDQQNRQLLKIRDTWTAAAKAALDAKLPEQFVQRVVGVQRLSNQAEETLLGETDRLMEAQVQISQARAQVDDVLDLLNATEAALRDRLFVIDSPPIWRVLHGSDFRESWQSITQRLKGASAHTWRFYQAYRSRLLLYFFFAIGIFAIVLRFSRQDRTAWSIEGSAQLECLRHPVALTGFLLLVLFAPVFAKAPAEVLRLSQFLMVVTVLFLATRIFEKNLRRYAVTLGLFSVFNAISVQLTSGTVVRRLFVMLLAGTMLAAMFLLLRKGGMIRVLLEERGWNFVFVCCYVGGCLLLISIFSNVVGNVSLADVLGNGTIFGAYYGVAAYVFYIAFTAVTFAFTGSKLGQSSRAVGLHRDLVNRRLASLFKKAVWLLWAVSVLYAFQILPQTIAEIGDVLRYKLQIGAISLSLLDVVVFGLVLYVSTTIAKLVRFLLNEEFLPRTFINPGAAQAGSRLTYAGLLIVGIFIALGAAGLELSKLTLLTGAVGVGLGFGLQNVVNNFVSGIIVSIERPVEVGNFIEVGTLFGEVRTIGFRSSTVRTFDGADVIVPNSELISKSVVNWSLTDFDRRTNITVGAAYGTDPDRVIAILTRIAAAHPDVMKYPAPLITFDQFGDSSLNFTLRFWSRLDSWLRVRSELNTQIAREFEKDGIKIPFPQRDLHLHMEGTTPVQELPAEISARAANAGHSDNG
jgi:potassium-dependent mechanosensitive channel